MIIYLFVLFQYLGLFSMHLQIAINTFYAKIATAENYSLKKNYRMILWKERMFTKTSGKITSL